MFSVFLFPFVLTFLNSCYYYNPCVVWNNLEKNLNWIELNWLRHCIIIRTVLVQMLYLIRVPREVSISTYCQHNKRRSNTKIRSKLLHGLVKICHQINYILYFFFIKFARCDCFCDGFSTYTWYHKVPTIDNGKK